MATVGVGSGVVLLERQRNVAVVVLERLQAAYCWSCNIGTSVCNVLLELERQRITSINASSQTTKEPSQTFRHPEILKATLS